MQARECPPPAPASAFTAINQPYLPTPGSSGIDFDISQSDARAPTSSGRQRNPAVAAYLGLGAETDKLSRFANSTPPSAQAQEPATSKRKRRKQDVGPSSPKRKAGAAVEREPLKRQRRVSDGLRATAPVASAAENDGLQSVDENGSQVAVSTALAPPVVLSKVTVKSSSSRLNMHMPPSKPKMNVDPLNTTTTKTWAGSSAPSLISETWADCLRVDSSYIERQSRISSLEEPSAKPLRATSPVQGTRVQLHLESLDACASQIELAHHGIESTGKGQKSPTLTKLPNHPAADAPPALDEYFELLGLNYFDHIMDDQSTNERSTHEQSLREDSSANVKQNDLGQPNDDFDGGLDDDDLMMLTSADACNGGTNFQHIPSSSNTDLFLDRGRTITPVTSPQRTDPAVFVQDRLLQYSTSLVKKGNKRPNPLPEKVKPIVRSLFPSQVRDRSPIIGLSSNTLLRTCFRIGEALNAGRQAARNNKEVLLEIYARVQSSHREETKQHFVFGDLFHSNPPYINGFWATWKGVELFEYDSSLFLQGDGKMCRCIGKLKRDGKTWVLVVHNIFVATWEDVAWAEGIVNA